MTLTEQVQILNDKIRANKAQYGLDRRAAKISALSSAELEKYEYLTGEDLGYKPDVVQNAKFEYSPLVQVFNKGLDASVKKEGLSKRLKNIGGRNEQQLEVIRNQRERQLEAIRDFSAINRPKEIKFSGEKSEEQKALTKEIEEINRKNRSKNFMMVHSNRTLYNFNKFRELNQLVLNIYNGVITIKDAEKEQDELASERRDLIDHDVRNQKKDEQKQEVLKNARQLFEIRNKIIYVFQNGIFPPPENAQEKQADEEESRLKRKKNRLKMKKNRLKSKKNRLKKKQFLTG